MIEYNSLNTGLKITETQIKALEWQVKNTYKGSWLYTATKELLEQLKKLREE